MNAMPRYLTVHDYGTGGLWWHIDAKSAREITDRFPTLTVFEEAPPWWREEMKRLTGTHRLGTPLNDAVLAGLEGRTWENLGQDRP